MLLAETDAVRARTSKKDEALRREEILKAASPALIELLENRKRAEEIIRDPGGSLLVTEIMLYADGGIYFILFLTFYFRNRKLISISLFLDKSKATETLVSLLDESYPSPADGNPHVIDVPHACRVYKTLLQGGHFSHASRTVIRSPEALYSPSRFASAWLKYVDRERTRAIGLGGGAFVLAALVERLRAEGDDADKKELKRWFDEDYVKEVTEKDVKGKKVLLAVLES